MKLFIFIFYIILSFSSIFAEESHFKNISKIEMDVLRNDKVIGYSNYFFKHDDENMTVENHTKFSVDMFGVKIFSIDSKSKEIYKKGNLTSFVSQTFQNDKLKFVKLNYDKKKNIFIIDGSSYKGEARTDNIIGNWWNPKILNAKTQISPLSGSIKKQSVKLTGKGEIKFKDKKIKLFRYKLKSTEDLPDDKKLDFDILIDSNEGIIFQVKYNRLGSWEYRVKNYE